MKHQESCEAGAKPTEEGKRVLEISRSKGQGGSEIDWCAQEGWGSRSLENANLF